MLLRLTCLLLLSLCLPLAALAADGPLREVRPGLYAGGQPSAAQLQALIDSGTAGQAELTDAMTTLTRTMAGIY